MESSSLPWRSVFDVAAVPLSVIDTTGRLVAWNEACAEMLGYPYDGLGALEVGRITRPEDQAWTRRYLMSLTSGEVDRFETDKIYVRGDGSEIRTRLTCRALADADGQCTHIAATILPLTEDAATAEVGGDARTRLLVSNELRNPLHAVHGLAELIADEDLSPRASELVESLLRQISALTRVTEDLLGVGSRFDVALPVPPCIAPAPNRAPEPLGGVRVMVVEDNPVNQQLARRQLERLGVDAVVVGTGEEGYERLIAEPPGAFDVILMDHQLPGWSGVETTERIRSLDGPRGDTAIVGVSASSAVADRSRFLAAGMDDLVTKPATLGDLAEAIRRVTSGRDTGATSATSGDPTDESRPGGGPRDNDVAALDRSVLDQLEDELGDDGIVATLVATFLRELDDRIIAITSSDDEASRRAAHTLQSSARLLGVTALADACHQVERGTVDRAIVVELAAGSRARLEDWLHDRSR